MVQEHTQAAQLNVMGKCIRGNARFESWPDTDYPFWSFHGFTQFLMAAVRIAFYSATAVFFRMLLSSPKVINQFSTRQLHNTQYWYCRTDSRLNHNERTQIKYYSPGLHFVEDRTKKWRTIWRVPSKSIHAFRPVGIIKWKIVIQ